MNSANFSFRNAAAALACVFVFPLTASAQSATVPFPSIQIAGFTNVPSNTCTSPAASVDVIANGNATTSDSYVVLVNGTLVFTWEGEDMAWANPPGPVSGYRIFGATGTFAANSVVTGRITTYAGVNSNVSDPTTGQVPAYSSEISWDCTTGAQVGAIVNRDLLAPAPVPTLNTGAFALLSLAIALAGWFRLRKPAE